MDLFKKIRNKYPLIEENGNMFKLLLILRSRSTTLFGMLTPYMFFDIAEYLFFDEYAAEKLYLVKLYNICLGNGNQIFYDYEKDKEAPLTIKEALSIPIEGFYYVTSVGVDGKITRLDLQSTFSFRDLSSNWENYMTKAKVYIDQPRIPSPVPVDNWTWTIPFWRNIQRTINTFYPVTRIYKHTRRNRNKSFEDVLGVQKDVERKSSPCRKHFNKQNYKRYNSIIKGRYRK